MSQNIVVSIKQLPTSQATYGSVSDNPGSNLFTEKNFKITRRSCCYDGFRDNASFSISVGENFGQTRWFVYFHISREREHEAIYCNFDHEVVYLRSQQGSRHSEFIARINIRSNACALKHRLVLHIQWPSYLRVGIDELVAAKHIARKQ